jgi:hypothetical protein
MNDEIDVQSALAETWQKIPEEERGELLARAKAQGVESCCVCLLIGCALAISLKAQWIALGTIAFLPLLYQVVSTQIWLEIKPLATISYFLAATTSRIYAQHLRSQDPCVKMIFRGSLESVPAQVEDAVSEEFPEEAADERPAPKDVWISLFPDALIMISEGIDGANLEFAHSTLRDFQVALDSPDGEETPSRSSRLLIQTTANDSVASRWVVSSPHPATLVACERKIRYFSQRSHPTNSEA